MIFSRLLPRPRLGPGISLAALVAAVLMPAPASEAGINLESSSGSTLFSLFDTSTVGAPALPQYNSLANGGALTAPGGGLPYLSSAPLPGFQTAGQDTLVPSFTASAVLPAFGTATTQISAFTSTPTGGTTTQGGVFFTSLTSLADALAPGTTGMASVSVSTGIATFTNTGPGTITVLPGTIMNVTGIVDSSAGSFVAAGLQTFITTDGVTTRVDPITLAAGNGQLIASTGNDLTNPNLYMESATSSLSKTTSGATVLSGTGTAYAPTTVTLLPNQTVTVEGILTLISDPGSSIRIASGTAPGFSGPIPTFGVFANVPAEPAAAVPEPSTIVLLGAGLAMAGLWSRSSRRRTPAGS